MTMLLRLKRLIRVRQTIISSKRYAIKARRHGYVTNDPRQAFVSLREHLDQPYHDCARFKLEFNLTGLGRTAECQKLRQRHPETPISLGLRAGTAINTTNVSPPPPTDSRVVWPCNNGFQATAKLKLQLRIMSRSTSLFHVFFVP